MRIGVAHPSPHHMKSIGQAARVANFLATLFPHRAITGTERSLYNQTSEHGAPLAECNAMVRHRAVLGNASGERVRR